MSDGAIDHPVVISERDVAHGAGGDGTVDHHRPLLDSAETQNADVGLADYRQAKQASENSGIGNGKSALLNFLGLQLLGPSAFGKIVHGALNSEQIFFVRALNDRN